MESLLDFAPCGYISFREDGRIVQVNTTLSGWLGYAKEELEGKSIETIFNLATRIFYNTHLFPLIRMHSKAEEIFISLYTKHKKDIPVITNAERRTETGQALIHCVFLTVYQRRKYEDEILKARRDAENALNENRHLQELRNSLESQTLELDKQYQRQLTINQDLLQFSKIISHDLQEPLRKIQLFSDVLSGDELIMSTPKRKSGVDKINKAAERLRKLISGLQQYVTVDSERTYKEVDLNTVVQNAKSKVIGQRAADALEIVCENLPTIQGYETQLELLFFHLIDNSFQFQDPSRKLLIKISVVEFDENLYKVSKDRYKFSEHLKLSFADNGIGFENAHRHYVFELLKKINPATQGLGIGLSLIKKIVENHSGTLNVESAPGLGTTFTMVLPVRFISAS
ncbi:MAG TPA: PAS domain-containing sensor histidine kinase [Chryseolinea sp.]|nr:PAS domain-containing sensor histidine kinase [Chryseolinea sp.]